LLVYLFLIVKHTFKAGFGGVEVAHLLNDSAGNINAGLLFDAVVQHVLGEF